MRKRGSSVMTFGGDRFTTVRLETRSSSCSTARKPISCSPRASCPGRPMVTTWTVGRPMSETQPIAPSFYTAAPSRSASSNTTDLWRNAASAENRRSVRGILVGVFSRNNCRGLTTCIPPIVRPRNIGCGWPLGVTILAVVKAVFGVGWNTECRTKAVALYISAAAKRARIKFDFTHDLARNACRRSGQAKI
jgi:hypothetical protein